MSLTDSPNKVIYAGDGITTVFDITFALPSGSTGSDVYVYVVDLDGNITKLTSNYSVDVNAKTVTYPITAGVAPLESGVAEVPVGWELVIYRAEPLSQTLQLINQGVLDLPSLEKAYDKLTMICQQLQEQVSRCFKMPINLPPDESTPVVPPSSSVALWQGSHTLAELVALSDASPTIAMNGIATDVGGGQLVFYPGYASTSGINGTGWYAIGSGL